MQDQDSKKINIPETETTKELPERIKRLRRKIEDKIRKDFDEKQIVALARQLGIIPTRTKE